MSKDLTGKNYQDLKEYVNLVLGIISGSDAESVKQSVRDFLAEFGDTLPDETRNLLNGCYRLRFGEDPGVLGSSDRESDKP